MHLCVFNAFLYHHVCVTHPRVHPQASYESRREVQAQLQDVAPGTYCIVPSTFEPGVEMDFQVADAWVMHGCLHV